MSKLSRTINAVQKAIADTSAKITMEWPDGTRVFISRHVYAVRKPEKPVMEAADDAKLYYFEEMEEFTPLDWEKLKTKKKEHDAYWVKLTNGNNLGIFNYHEQDENHDKIQGDDKTSRMKDDSAS